VTKQEDADDGREEGPERKASLLSGIERGDEERRGEFAGTVTPDVRILELVCKDERKEERRDARDGDGGEDVTKSPRRSVVGDPRR